MISSLIEARINFHANAAEVARQLIGITLLVDGVGGRIVETEAYDQSDPASHTYTGPSARNAAMFGPGGYIYVYRSYGLHWCMNLVCREAGHGAGVLLRALEPTHGLEVMQKRRRMLQPRLLCAGPGRLAQALGVDHSFNGRALQPPLFALLQEKEGAEVQVVAGPRIGISKAVETPWRFGERGSRYVSKEFAPAPAIVSASKGALDRSDVKSGTPPTTPVAARKR